MQPDQVGRENERGRRKFTSLGHLYQLEESKKKPLQHRADLPSKEQVFDDLANTKLPRLSAGS